MTHEGFDPDTEARRVKRILIGEPLPTEHLDAQLLPKRRALPIFASDALSSVAYAPQELLMILLLGGLAFLSFAPWVAACVILLLLVVVASYRQLIKAYPSGGGDYEVAQKNLGERSALVVAAALLVDYVLTVAVSVASGVDNIISAFPTLDPWRVQLAIGFVVLITMVNLRGARESSAAFAFPTYLFIASIVLMVATGLVRSALGDAPVAWSSSFTVEVENLSQIGMILLLLRAFASGCSALTGVEAISNGVPAFRAPKIANAQTTLTMMGLIAVTLFAGLITLALIAGVHYAEDACHLIGFTECESQPQPTLIAQLAAATFGGSSALFYVTQAATAAVLLLAANTAFNGFPLLGAVLARDSYAPKSLNSRGDRLVFSNGCIALALAASVILVLYQANVTALIQLYIIGVFTSFTIGQIGMVRHWIRMRRRGGSRSSVRRGLVINGGGAVFTASVLIIVAVTKFTHGAWLVFLLIPFLYVLLRGINRYYRRVEHEIEADDDTVFGSTGDVALVLVGRLQKPTLKALDYAIAAQHDTILAVHVSIDAEETSRLETAWAAHNIRIPLIILDAPLRDMALPIAQFIANYRHDHGHAVVTLYLPQYIVGHWWEKLLHNRRARRLSQRLMVLHGVSIALVPWRLESSKLILSRRPRPVPGQERRGIPVQPPVRQQRRRTSRKRG